MLHAVGFKPQYSQGSLPYGATSDRPGISAAMNGRDFAARLKDYIDRTPGMTPAGLAVQAGLDNSTIRGLLTGKAQGPRLETALKICEAIGTTLEEFLGDPRTQEERDILRLLSQLPVDQRRRLLGYAEALRDAQDPRSPEPLEENE